MTILCMYIYCTYSIGIFLTLKKRQYNDIHCLSKKKLHTQNFLDRLLLWFWSTFAVALFQQPYAMSQHLFPSRVALIFGRDFVMMTGESNHSFSLFQHIPCVKMTPRAPVSSCSMHAFTTRARWILALLSCNMPQPSGKKISIDGITWSFSTFRNSADVLCLDLNWSSPRS